MVAINNCEIRRIFIVFTTKENDGERRYFHFPESDQLWVRAKILGLNFFFKVSLKVRCVLRTIGRSFLWYIVDSSMSISSALNIIDGILKPPKTLDDKRYVISTELLIPIKLLCQGSDEAAFDISRHLDYSLSSSKNLVVSTRCLVIMDFLMSVTACRSFVNDHTKTIVDKFKSRPSIKTKKLLEEFKEKCKFYIELWDISYHDSCPHISVTRRYLEDSLRCDMPRLEEKAKQHNVQKVENQQIEDKKVLLRCKELVNGSIVSDIEDIRTALDSLRNLLLIVFPFNIDFRASGMAVPTVTGVTTSSSYRVDRNDTMIGTDGDSRGKSDQLCFVDEDGEVIDFVEDDDDDEHNRNKSSKCVENLNQYNDADDAGADDYDDVEWEEDKSDSNVAEFSPKRQKTFMDENYATGVSKASNSNVLAALGSVPYAIVSFNLLINSFMNLLD